MTSPTVRTVLAIPGRPVLLRVGSDALDRPVRWVAVSELADPTPYLAGGELLLTTGIRLTPRRCDAYVRRLVEADVAALGLGIGLTHDVVPAELVEAAERHGLPLLEIPEPTPFIAISKAVSDVVAAGEYEAVTRAVEVQRDLTRAALAADGPAAVVRRLAKGLGADVVLLDPKGQPQEASAGIAPERLAEITDAVLGMRSRGARASASFADADRSLVVQPLAPAGKVTGYLAVGRSAPFSTVDHSLVIVAVALVSSLRERRHGGGTALRALRSAVLELLADGVAAERLPLANIGWPWLPAGPLLVLQADGPRDRLTEALDTLDELVAGGDQVAAAVVGERLVMLVPERAEGLPDPADVVPGLPVGVSEPVPVGQVAQGLRQAAAALAVADRPGRHEFAGLGRHGVVGLVEPAAASGFAQSLLAPLLGQDRGDLLPSTRAWLAHHGQWDAAASSLGVHRHTLRHRMRRVEELLGRSLDDPDVRADLWVALSVHARDETER